MFASVVPRTSPGTLAGTLEYSSGCESFPVQEQSQERR